MATRASNLERQIRRKRPRTMTASIPGAAATILPSGKGPARLMRNSTLCNQLGNRNILWRQCENVKQALGKRLSIRYTQRHLLLWRTLVMASNYHQTHSTSKTALRTKKGLMIQFWVSSAKILANLRKFHSKYPPFLKNPLQTKKKNIFLKFKRTIKMH